MDQEQKPKKNFYKNERYQKNRASVNYFSTFNDTLEHFNEIWIVLIYCIYIMIIFWESRKKSARSEIMAGVGGPPQSIHEEIENMKSLGGGLPCLPQTI